jgi:hypothetical protein
MTLGLELERPTGERLNGSAVARADVLTPELHQAIGTGRRLYSSIALEP